MTKREELAIILFPVQYRQYAWHKEKGTTSKSPLLAEMEQGFERIDRLLSIYDITEKEL